MKSYIENSMYGLNFLMAFEGMPFDMMANLSY